ncbi:MAG: hypothetical protein CMK32_07985 [Porticoccaceae bacterium]|nr:hypothetical protein [Porticoccaceae bacterium]
MKITADSSALDNCVRAVSSACPTRTPQEILQSIKIECTDGVVSMVATDNVRTIVKHLDVIDAEEDGCVLIPAKQAAAIANSVSGDVSISCDGGAVVVKAGADKFRINTEPCEKHPADAGKFATSDYCHTFKRESFLTALRRVVFAASRSPGRYATDGVAFDFPVDGECYLVACDGSRTAAHLIGGESFKEHKCSTTTTVVPTVGMKSLLTVLSLSESDDISVSSRASDIVVFGDDFVFGCRLLEGRYPSPWRKMLVMDDTDGFYNISVSCAELLSAVRKSSIVSDTESLAVKCVFGAGQIHFERTESVVGSSSVSIAADGPGEESSVLMNLSLLREWLSTIHPEDIVRIDYPKTPLSKIQFSTDEGSYYSQGTMGKE